MNYYNENDAFAADWLEELIKAKLIAHGVVDRRGIEDVFPRELTGFTQCHFFAGIGGWSYALRLAGWPDDAPVWTGSCPCQPFSQAGKGAGFIDERHLWPAWFHLIQQCKPHRIYGEQVVNLQWWDLVCSDLEAEGYATWAIGLNGPCVEAPHLRQRLYWMGDTSSSGSWRHSGSFPSAQGRVARSVRSESHELIVAGTAYQLGESNSNGCTARSPTSAPAGHRHPIVTAGCDWIMCSDGKRRPVEPGTLPLVDGIPGRVGRVRGYGNAIIPQVAAVFIKATI